jgi:hypothetical protein
VCPLDRVVVQQRGEAMQWIAPEPLRDLLRRPIRAGVDLGVPLVPIREAFEQRRTFATPCAGEGCRGGVAHCQHVVAVDHLRWNGIRSAPAGDVGSRRDHHRGPLAVEIVLAHVDDGQTAYGGEVHALVEVRLVDRAVSEERDCYRPVPGELGGECRARRGGDRAADDAEATNQPALDVGDVHRSATAAVGSSLAAEQLRHQRGRVDTECERGTVPPVRGGNRVTGLYGRADSDRNGLLSLAEVRRTLDLVGQEEA